MTEFYQGWMVELLFVERCFQFTCHSPHGKQVRGSTLYPSRLEALQAAFMLINQFSGCYALRSLLREWYETEVLEFAEYQSLCQSLDFISRR